MTLVLKFCFVLFLAHLASSSTPVDNIKLDHFMVRLKNGLIWVYSDSASGDKGKSQPPIIELGVHGINPNKAKDLGKNKLGFRHTTLELKNDEKEDRCMEVAWHNTENTTLEDCFLLGPYNWYGGPEQSNQYWPVEKAKFNDYSYVTKIEDSMGIAEPYWLNSNGLMFYVNPSTPLFIDQNNRQKGALCLLAKNAPPYLRKGGPSLQYTVCKFDNPREAHEYAIKRFLGKPSGIPDERMVEQPIWSTWARYKTKINEHVVLQFAQEIKDHGFNNSQLEIDDMWETCYGSLTFNKTTFPNMKRLTTQLNQMGFRTTIWVHPFVNLDCSTHQEGAAKGYFVKNTKGNTTTEWWNGVGSYVDFTNKAAADWYEKRLQRMLAEGGIDSLKFDAGESGWAPQVPVLNGPELAQPEILTQKYVELAANFGPMIEVRTGRNTQRLPVFVRMLDRNSKWGIEDIGIHSVITTTFQMNLNGYPLVLPDMVGGNAYNGEEVTKELFIRYLQLNVFMPCVQLSITPWDFDSETVELSKKFLSLHYQYSKNIIDSMKKAVQTGHPINPPIWWVDPTNKETYGINSEYMLGEDILVAPVIEQGATSRDIYLPKGQWRDEAKAGKPVHTGPVWLRNYPAPLDTLPYFTRVSSGAYRQRRFQERSARIN